MTSYLLLAAGAQGPSPMTSLFIPMALILLIFYLLLIRPEKTKRKALEQQIEALKKGDRVVTTGGLYGEVVKTDDAAVILKLAENVKVKVAKRAIAGLEGSPEEKGGR